MNEHILFLTGRLAERQLRQVLADMAPEFQYTVLALGVKVAALMNTEMIARRLTDLQGATRVIIPGRCPGDLEALSRQLGVPVERGPEEVKDLPRHFGRRVRQADLSRYRTRIFAEIVEAPHLDVAGILARAAYYRSQGADVIDVGCQPGVPFPHLAEAVQALKAEGWLVSVDSLEPEDLVTGGRAGADYLLSLSSRTLWVADEVAATPIVIPDQHGDLDSLEASIAALRARGRDFIVDPILDPIHFGFTESLVRFHTFRSRHPTQEMMMGVGNLTELTHADTAGINALLLGVCSELDIGNILATEVSAHARRAIREADRARRIMHAAHAVGALPKHVSEDLLALHELDPYPYSRAEIEGLAGEIRDPSWRIQVSREGVHVFNRDGVHTAQDPFDLYPHLQVADDGGHAFYLGVELARAEIAWQLGKRYTQDQPLGWACAVEETTPRIDLHAFRPAGSTFDKE